MDVEQPAAEELAAADPPAETPPPASTAYDGCDYSKPAENVPDDEAGQRTPTVKLIQPSPLPADTAKVKDGAVFKTAALESVPEKFGKGSTTWAFEVLEWKWEGNIVARGFVDEKREEPSLTKVKYSEKGKETNIPDDCDMVMTSGFPAGLTACWRLPADTAWCRRTADRIRAGCLGRGGPDPSSSTWRGVVHFGSLHAPGARCRVLLCRVQTVVSKIYRRLDFV